MGVIFFHVIYLKKMQIKDFIFKCDFYGTHIPEKSIK